MLLKGSAKLDRVLYTKDIEIGAAIVDFIVSRRAKVETVVEEWESRLQLDVDVDARDAIRIRNNIASVTGSSTVRISGTLANPVMLGSATFDDGALLRINTIDYRIVNGSVNFQNPFRIDPFLDLTGEGRYQNEYDVTIIVSGTPDALQMSVSSDPPISDLSILNVFGIQTATTSGSVTTRESAESASGSIIDSSVGTLVGSKLGFADNLRLEGLTGPAKKVHFAGAPTVPVLAMQIVATPLPSSCGVKLTESFSVCHVVPPFGPVPLSPFHAIALEACAAPTEPAAA